MLFYVFCGIVNEFISKCRHFAIFPYFFDQCSSPCTPTKNYYYYQIINFLLFHSDFILIIRILFHIHILKASVFVVTYMLIRAEHKKKIIPQILTKFDGVVGSLSKTTQKKFELSRWRGWRAGGSQRAPTFEKNVFFLFYSAG